ADVRASAEDEAPSTSPAATGEVPRETPAGNGTIAPADAGKLARYLACSVAACELWSCLRQANSIASRLFRSVECRVSGLHQFVARGAMFRQGGGSGADGHGSRHPRELPAFHHLPQFLRHAQSLLGVDLRQQDSEFLAAIAAHNVYLAHLLVK